MIHAENAQPPQTARRGYASFARGATRLDHPHMGRSLYRSSLFLIASLRPYCTVLSYLMNPIPLSRR